MTECLKKGNTININDVKYVEICQFWSEGTLDTNSQFMVVLQLLGEISIEGLPPKTQRWDSKKKLEQLRLRSLIKDNEHSRILS